MLLLTAALGGCSQTPETGLRTRPPTAGLDDVDSFALALSVDPSSPAFGRLGRYDLVVVDGDMPKADFRRLKRRGALVLGYLSVGTVEPYRPWFREAKAEGWLLERWDDWDEWYVDVNEARFRQRLRREARAILSRGADGLFLDNMDMVETHPTQRPGMRKVLAELDRTVGPRILMAQNGDAFAWEVRSHLDAWNREDVSTSTDGDRYLVNTRADRRTAVRALRRLGRALPLVTATDYTASGDLSEGSTARRAIAVACEAGAVPFVSNRDLSRIPSTPPRCPTR